jgi:beta-ribofuranosylaminobenzene 5'-phosphate synthase
MTRVTTGSRLHFGLLRPPPTGGDRGFGGCGLMVDEPGVSVVVEPAATWSAEGPAAERALVVARRVTDQPHRVVVEACPPEHTGLGVGTQLSLAIARALRPAASVADLARLTGRGRRSAIGVHGFEAGGFLVDGGKLGSDGLAPLVAWAEFPDEWRIVLLTPTVRPKWHGDRERDAFAKIAGPADDALCRLVLLGMLPALAERDIKAFGEALHEYNRRAGEPFRTAQGGVYAAPAVEEIINWLRLHDTAGAGQTSWGPTVFAVAESAERAAWIQRTALESLSIEQHAALTSGRKPDLSADVIKSQLPTMKQEGPLG